VGGGEVERDRGVGVGSAECGGGGGGEEGGGWCGRGGMKRGVVGVGGCVDGYGGGVGGKRRGGA